MITCLRCIIWSSIYVPGLWLYLVCDDDDLISGPSSFGVPTSKKKTLSSWPPHPTPQLYAIKSVNHVCICCIWTLCINRCGPRYCWRPPACSGWLPRTQRPSSSGTGWATPAATPPAWAPSRRGGNTEIFSNRQGVPELLVAHVTGCLIIIALSAVVSHMNWSGNSYGTPCIYICSFEGLFWNALYRIFTFLYILFEV